MNFWEEMSVIEAFSDGWSVKGRVRRVELRADSYPRSKYSLLSRLTCGNMVTYLFIDHSSRFLPSPSPCWLHSEYG